MQTDAEVAAGLMEERVSGPLGMAIIRRWPGSSAYLNFNGGGGERYVGASTDLAVVRKWAAAAVAQHLKQENAK